MKIYTKTGDQGNTKLLYGDTVSKDSLAPEAYGSVDELVASLGLIRAEEKLPIEIKETLLRIQRELFVVGAELATSKENRIKLKSKKPHIKFFGLEKSCLSKKNLTKIKKPIFYYTIKKKDIFEKYKNKKNLIFENL